MRIAIRRMIAAPPEVVFRIYTDPARVPEWQPGVKGVIEQTGPLDQPGTTYVLDQPGPRFGVEVLRVDAPRLHQQREGSVGMAGSAPRDSIRFWMARRDSAMSTHPPAGLAGSGCHFSPSPRRSSAASSSTD
jgi:hypothetical protein